jgi:glycosyltransferase involved in cell wall biosynthesis
MTCPDLLVHDSPARRGSIVRIGFFTDSYLPALHGVEVSIEAFRQSLEKAGHEIFVFAPAVPGYTDTNPNVFRLKSLRVIEKPEMRLAFPFAERGHMRDLLQVKLDIVHAHTPFTLGLVARHISARQGIPLVYTHHTHYPEYAKAYLKDPLILPVLAQALSTWFSNLADEVIAPSPKIKRLLKTYGVTRPIHVLPTGVSLAQFRNTRVTHQRARALRKRLGIDRRATVLLFVGRMGREKNIEFLIRAFAELRNHRADVAFLLVGDGPFLPQLRLLAKRLGARDIVFAGAVEHEQVPVYYQAANLFVFASRTDTQGIVILEALASRIGVVALRDAAFTDMVIDGRTGLLVDPRASPRSFASRVTTLVDTPRLLRRFGKNALHMAGHFAEDEQAKKLSDIYQRLALTSRASTGAGARLDAASTDRRRQA